MLPPAPASPAGCVDCLALGICLPGIPFALPEKGGIRADPVALGAWLPTLGLPEERIDNEGLEAPRVEGEAMASQSWTVEFDRELVDDMGKGAPRSGVGEPLCPSW